MTGRPLVSVLTPSYEQAAWLSENLRSVAVQTYPAVEHVVMDGGSRDGTRDVLRANERPSLRWWSEPDDGQSHALNKALAKSSGDLIGWLNSDDAYYAPSVIADVVALFARRPDIAVVYGHAALVNADGLLLHFVWAPPFSRRLLKLHDFITQPAAFFRRDVLDGRLADESFEFAMDYELWLRLSATRAFARIDRVVAADRHHAARKSTRMLDTLDADLVRLRDRYGIDSGLASRIARKAWKVAARLAGASLIPRFVGEPRAFTAHVDAPTSILRRQIGMRRATMPVGTIRHGAGRSS